MDKEMLQKYADAANQTWDAIAWDCFVDDYGKHDPSKTFTRDEVAEIVFDASYMQMHGGLTQEEMRTFYNDFSEADKNKIKMEAFGNYEVYGY